MTKETDKIMAADEVPEKGSGKMELIATKKVNINAEMYKVVDFLNKNLKKHNLMFGLSKRGEEMIISIYEVE